MAYGIFGWKDSPFNMPLRFLFLVGGAMMLFPGAEVTGWRGGDCGTSSLNKIIRPRRRRRCENATAMVM